MAQPSLPLNEALLDPLRPTRGAVVTRTRRTAQGSRGVSEGVLGLSTAIDLYLVETARSKATTPKTEVQRKATLRMFLEFVGDVDLRSVKRTQVAEFRGVLHDLPSTHGKTKATKGKDIRTVALETKGTGVATLSGKTIKRHVTFLLGFFKWAISEAKYETENPASGFSFARSKRPTDQRPAWTAEQLGSLLSSPVWRGSLSPLKRSEPGPIIIRDDRYFVPLLGIFAGLRLEEACQLKVSDIGILDGIPLIQIQPDDDKQLKSQAAVRRVPIHPALVQAGFLDFVRAAQDIGRVMLFEGLRRGGPDKRLGYYWSKEFTKYRRAIKLYAAGLDFHAFRHSFTTALVEGGVDRAIIDQLTGHEGAGETSRYTKALSPALLYEAVSKIAYGALDLRHLAA